MLYTDSATAITMSSQSANRPRVHRPYLFSQRRRVEYSFSVQTRPLKREEEYLERYSTETDGGHTTDTSDNCCWIRRQGSERELLITAIFWRPGRLSLSQGRSVIERSQNWMSSGVADGEHVQFRRRRLAVASQCIVTRFDDVDVDSFTRLINSADA